MTRQRCIGLTTELLRRIHKDDTKKMSEAMKSIKELKFRFGGNAMSYEQFWNEFLKETRERYGM